MATGGADGLVELEIHRAATPWGFESLALRHSTQ